MNNISLCCANDEIVLVNVCVTEPTVHGCPAFQSGVCDLDVYKVSNDKAS